MSHDDLDTQKNRTIAEPNPIITAAAVAGIGGGGAIQNMTSSLTTTGTTIASSFVKKLFDMVENESDEIIVWVANGTAFEVKDPKRLEIEILPNFFRHGRFQSLVRQLNFYAFKKISKERSSWVYSHDHFQKNRPDLLEQLRRKTNGVAVKRNAEVLNSLNSLRKKRRNSNPNLQQKDSSDDSFDEYCDEELGENFEGNSSQSSDLPMTSNKRQGWSTAHHFLDQSSTADETANDSFSVMCKCWDDVHQYFGLHENCPLQQSQDEEDEDSLSELSPSEQIDSTLNRLFSFCSQRNPWIESHDLFADIYQLLTTDSHMTTEINDYFAALSPSSKLKHDIQILKTNEITIVRTFITYALARLHELEESSYLSTPLQLLSQSIDKWSSYARMCT